MTDLASVIKQVETGGKAWRRRFEPGVFAWEMDIYDRTAIVKNIASINECSLATAHVMFSESYGAYQEMGFNLWSVTAPLIKVDEFTFRGNPTMQDQAFFDFLKMHGINFQLQELLDNPDKMQRFCQVWNGPADVADYAAKIRLYAQA